MFLVCLVSMSKLSLIIDIYRYLPVPNENGCINNRTVRQFQYDLLYTDVTGIGFIINTFGPYWSELR